MKLLALLLLAAGAQAQIRVSFVFEYNQMPSCARECAILEKAEAVCLPPAAPHTNKETYKDCVCQSEYLQHLYTGGELCHGPCNYDEGIIIHNYYSKLCNVPHNHDNPSHSMVVATTLSTVITTPTLASPTLVSSSLATSTTTNLLPAVEDTHNVFSSHSHKLSHDMKVLAIVLPIALGTLTIIAISIFVTRRIKRKRQAEKDKRRFVSLKRYVSKSYHPDDPENFIPRSRFRPVSTTGGTGGGESSSSTGPQEPQPVFDFTERLRQFKKEKGVLDDTEYSGSRAPEAPSPYPMKLLEETEKLIRARLQSTGRPDARFNQGRWC
ncbi:hypothetical protein IQ07DRAFT_360096 [Pyrenochaeta sp. DS3sAY3a]|nr:hypothetical protein IQ07DRAFT_360096 [Pyrenochaeta sp. DS3sAY3a]